MSVDRITSTAAEDAAVLAGALELESVRGDRIGFVSGDVLFLGGLPLRALRNRGSIPALLCKVARRPR